MARFDSDEIPQSMYNTAGIRVWLSKNFYEDFHRFRIVGEWGYALEAARSMWLLVHHRLKPNEIKEIKDLYNIANKDIVGISTKDHFGNIKLKKGNYRESVFNFALRIEELLYKYGMGMPDRDDPGMALGR